MKITVSPDEIYTEYRDKVFSYTRSKIQNYQDAEDLINIGAYKKGSNAAIDESIAYIGKVNEFLMQATDEKFTYEETKNLMHQLFE